MLTLFRNGHGCMLQYALLHLFGYKVTMDDLKHFRVSLQVSTGTTGTWLTILALSMSTASPQVTQSPMTLQASKLRQGLWARVSPMLLV